MDAIQCMRVFVRVAHRFGFAAAGRDLGMSPAAVTKHVASLEARLGARLFDRTTRRVALTEAGAVYLERCLVCLEAFEDAEASVHALTGAPTGRLRVTAPVDLQTDLSVVIARYMAAHRAVKVDVKLSNRPMDLIDEGIDVALRVASPTLTGDFIARPLAMLRMGVVAAPSYLDRHGRPSHPSELPRRPQLVFTEPRPRLGWAFARGDERVEVTLEPVLTTNSGTALLVAAAEGAGITIAPSLSLRPFVDSGQLELLLPDWRVVPDLRLFAVYPHRRFLSPTVATFVAALRETWGDGRSDPFWPER